MTDFSNQAPPFDKWDSKQEREAFHQLLWDIVEDWSAAGVGVAVSLGQYHEIFTGELDKRIGGPYGLATSGLITTVAELLRTTSLEEDVAYVFETGALGSAYVLEAFETNARGPAIKDRFSLHSLTFQNNRAALPLQAADMLAYECYRRASTLLGDRRPFRPYSAQQTDRQPFKWRSFDETMLQEWASFIQSDLDSGR